MKADHYPRSQPEWPVILAPIARGDDRGIFLGDNKFVVPSQELIRLLRRLSYRSGYVLTVVLPRLNERCGSAEIGETRERSRVLRVDRENLSQTTANVGPWFWQPDPRLRAPATAPFARPARVPEKASFQTV